MISTKSIAPALEPGWYLSPAFAAPRLELPGPSRLAPQERELLDDVSRLVTEGTLVLPPTPHTAMQALQALKAADVDFAGVAARISADPVLAALVLRQANSPLYAGRAGKSLSIQDALGRIGIRRMREVILSAVLCRTAAGLKSRAWAEMESTHALVCAELARLLGVRIGLEEEQCHTAGLLHDIGRLPLLKGLEARGALPDQPSRDGAAEIIVECLHRAVGQRLASSWGLPESVTDAAFHHMNGRRSDEPRTAEFRTTCVAELASDVCHALGLGRFMRPFNVLEAATQALPSVDRESLVDWLDIDVPALMSAGAGGAASLHFLRV